MLYRRIRSGFVFPLELLSRFSSFLSFAERQRRVERPQDQSVLILVLRNTISDLDYDGV